MARRYVLDTSLLLAGRDPPRDGDWVTTNEAAHEVSPGGRDARRFQEWQDLGLELRSPMPDSEDRVDEVAMQAGNLGRLSVADRSLLALALEVRGVLITDDHTMLDVAERLGLESMTVNADGIDATVDWKPRCSGCGKWFDAMPKGDECLICGSPVKSKPVRS